MAITMADFSKMIDRGRSGTPCGHGWGRYNVTCPRCRKKYEVIHIVMSRARARCPRCRLEKRYTWPIVSNAPLPAPCDGVWLEPVGWEQGTIITRDTCRSTNSS